MSLEFLNLLSRIPDHRRAQGRKWQLGPVVLATILAFVRGDLVPQGSPLHRGASRRPQHGV